MGFEYYEHLCYKKKKKEYYEHFSKTSKFTKKVDVFLLFVVRIIKKLVILEVHDPRDSTTGGGANRLF